MNVIFPFFFVGIFLLATFTFLTTFRGISEGKGAEQLTKADELTDSRASAERWISRLESEMLIGQPSDEKTKYLMGMAAQRHDQAASTLYNAKTPGQMNIAGEIAIEGLYYMREARVYQGEPAGAPLPEITRGD